MIEEWKDIPGYEGRYQASTLGRIKSVERYVRHNYGGLKKVHAKILKPIKQNNGYLSVWVEGKTKSIHRLVALAFLPIKENMNLVEHINHNKEDNRVSNLLWSNQSNNMRRNVKDGNWNNQYTITKQL